MSDLPTGSPPWGAKGCSWAAGWPEGLRKGPLPAVLPSSASRVRAQFTGCWETSFISSSSGWKAWARAGTTPACCPPEVVVRGWGAPSGQQPTPRPPQDPGSHHLNYKRAGILGGPATTTIRQVKGVQGRESYGPPAGDSGSASLAAPSSDSHGGPHVGTQWPMCKGLEPRAMEPVLG